MLLAAPVPRLYPQQGYHTRGPACFTMLSQQSVTTPVKEAIVVKLTHRSARYSLNTLETGGCAGPNELRTVGVVLLAPA